MSKLWKARLLRQRPNAKFSYSPAVWCGDHRHQGQGGSAGQRRLALRPAIRSHINSNQSLYRPIIVPGLAKQRQAEAMWDGDEGRRAMAMPIESIGLTIDQIVRVAHAGR